MCLYQILWLSGFYVLSSKFICLYSFMAFKKTLFANKMTTMIHFFSVLFAIPEQDSHHSSAHLTLAPNMSWGACGLRTALGIVSVDCWGCVPSLLVGLKHWSLQAIGCGQVSVPNGDLQESSHWGIFPGASTTSVLAPQWATANPCLSRRLSKTYR